MTSGSKEKRKTPRKLDLERVKKIFESEGAEFLDDFYKNMAYRHNYRCVCGHKGKITLASFELGSRCPTCKSNKIGRALRKTKEEVEEIYKEWGFIYIDEDYKGVDYPHRCICVCGREDLKSISNLRKGKKCMKCWSEGNRGENNPMWNSELSDDERYRRRRFFEYNEWVVSVHSKCDYTCFICEVRGAPILHAHHIVPYSKDEGLRTDLENGVTLCKECHIKYHREYSLTEVNWETLKEFKNKA